MCRAHESSLRVSKFRALGGPARLNHYTCLPVLAADAILITNHLLDNRQSLLSASHASGPRVAMAITHLPFELAETAGKVIDFDNPRMRANH